MSTNILDQKYFKDSKGDVYCIDIMEMNKNTWMIDVIDGWENISKDEAFNILNPPPSKITLIERAESHKKYLLDEANTITADWRTELALGIISDGDKAKLTAWMEYIKAVKAVDTSTVPNVAWPLKPEV
ncbi:tail fiber assembly protein [Edwardsiella tarda]|uniref:tail fiber assembly protein n=1 Tax=Edwardsiella tarda TaxID=636 RepID=UPI000D5158D7|nr:tail fiber assembly protein [Edwardsiella tarda]UCQ53273.1 tail fiber assembly protein [Edwardsiella tarda]